MSKKTNNTSWHAVWFLCALISISFETFACEVSKRMVSAGGYYNALSEHYEYFPSGSQILNEKGAIPGGVVNASISCDQWMLSGEFSQSKGLRDYTGMTMGGTPVSTISKIQSDASRLSISWRFIEPAELIADVVHDQILRDIISTPNAQGYPEYYDRSFVRIGGGWRIPTEFGLLNLRGLTSVSGNQTERVNLPGKDPTWLAFNALEQWEIAVSFQRMLNPSAFLKLEYRYINTAISQSRPSILTAAGNPVGVVYQPKTWNVDQPLILTVGIMF